MNKPKQEAEDKKHRVVFVDRIDRIIEIREHMNLFITKWGIYPNCVLAPSTQKIADTILGLKVITYEDVNQTNEIHVGIFI